jgi:hypothetical protein
MEGRQGWVGEPGIAPDMVEKWAPGGCSDGIVPRNQALKGVVLVVVLRNNLTYLRENIFQHKGHEETRRYTKKFL